MWLKLGLLLLYAVLLFILSRVLETVAWYENGHWARQILDPFSLSVKKLKFLLDQRGVSYAAVVEKSELSTLIDDSGEASQEELQAGGYTDNSTGVQSTSFTCGAHFYERVEDNKDSVWIVQVVHPPGSSLLKDTDWLELTRRLAPFDIRVGVFDCSLDYRFCQKKSWFSSRLILALPQGYSRAKDQVKLMRYTGVWRHQAVLDWVGHHLASRIHTIKDLKELEDHWCNFQSKNETSVVSWSVHVIMLSKLLLPPMFLSALSVKFTGRVKFGKVDIRTQQGKKMLKSLQKTVNKPSYIVLTPERNMTYGKRRGEILSHYSFDLFLRTLTPDSNDLFKVGLFVVNLTCLMGLAIDAGGLLRRIVNLLWNFIKYNCLFLLLWLPIIGLFHIPYMETVEYYTCKTIRFVNSTELAGYLRHDWLYYTSNPMFLISSFILYISCTCFIYRKFSNPDEEVSSNNWWSFTTDSYIGSYLFHPVTSLTRPAHPQDMEEGMELLIERLAVPHLWLQPMISNDYLKDLPIWTHNKHSATSSEEEENPKSDSETDDQKELLGRGTDSIICQHCVDAASLPSNLTERQCAEYMMDSDYKCMCNVRDKSDIGSTDDECKDIHMSDPHVRDTKLVQRQSLGGAPDGMLPSTECVICLDSYHYGNILCGLPCGHNFHENCIMAWIMRDNHCCPVCRWPSYKTKPCMLHLHSE